jgi:hypothetical protein
VPIASGPDKRTRYHVSTLMCTAGFGPFMGAVHMIVSARAWLEDSSSSLHSLAVFAIAYRRGPFARKRSGAKPRTRVERQGQITSTMSSLWICSSSLMRLTQETDEIEWESHFGSRMSIVIARVSNIVGDVPTLSTPLGLSPPRGTNSSPTQSGSLGAIESGFS